MIFGKNKSDEGSAGLTARVQELEKQNKILKDALEFYSNPRTWEAGHKYRDADDATIFSDGTESSATADKGAQAKRALESCS